MYKMYEGQSHVTQTLHFLSENLIYAPGTETIS